MDVFQQFFEDTEIFITGGSGVVGKALIEKLLRSCNVRRIYILLRLKKNRGVEERLDALKNDKIFCRVLREKPDCFDKVRGIAGDVSLPKLGISDEDREKLKDVNLFYHSAATVRFDEPLPVAITLNLGGTYEALLLAESFKKLKMFMHVSTFFSSPFLEHIEPKMNPAPMHWKFALEKLKYMDEFSLGALTKKIITGFPNTYCFTKNLAESLVNDFRHRLPVMIYRPSVVVQALEEPERGFPPALMGAMALFTLAGCGVVKSMYCIRDVCLDMTPLDFCAKLMIYYTVRASRVYQETGVPKEAPVYLASSYNLIVTPLACLSDMMMDNGLWVEYGLEKNLLIPGNKMTENRLLYLFIVFVQQLPTALLVDLLLRLFNKEPALMSINRKVFVALAVMDPFRTNKYSSPGMTHFDEMIKETENTEFSIRADLERCLHSHGILRTMKEMILGIRKHLLNEDPSTIERSRRIIKGKIIFYNIVRGILLYYFVMWFYRRFLSLL